MQFWISENQPTLQLANRALTSHQSSYPHSQHSLLVSEPHYCSGDHCHRDSILSSNLSIGLYRQTAQTIPSFWYDTSRNLKIL